MRFTTILNTKIDGALNKLLDSFIKTNFPKTISVFIDRRYDNSEMYKNLGFKFIAYTKPKSYYIIAGQHQRYNSKYFKEKILIKDSELILNKNYFQIFNVGTSRYDLIIK
jgi:hypothetical protein